MIYALNDQNEKINASKAEKGKSYYCPNLECPNRELIIKKGKIRIPHFAHRSLRDCSSEPESEEHILCKTYFQTLLNLDKQFVEYYGIEGVRPDVLYDQFALEIQCSPITVNEVSRRNNIYEKNGLRAIWIFLEDEFIIKKENFYRIKKPVLRSSFKDIADGNFKIFSFKHEYEAIKVSYTDYAGIYFDNKSKKGNKRIIKSKQAFDDILEEILTLNKKKIEYHHLKRKLNALPKYIQAHIYDSNLHVAHITGSSFYDGVNNFNIGMFLDEIFRKKNCSMELFKKYIEKSIIEAYTKNKKIEEWRNRNILDLNGKKYVPLCKLEKIYHETPDAYLIFSKQWIAKSCSFKDNKYLYCEEWMYKRIDKKFQDNKFYG